jgi:hypothetical protein
MTDRSPTRTRRDYQRPVSITNPHGTRRRAAIRRLLPLARSISGPGLWSWVSTQAGRLPSDVNAIGKTPHEQLRELYKLITDATELLDQAALGIRFLEKRLEETDASPAPEGRGPTLSG